MAEQLVNEFTVNRPIDEAWAVITDVERIAPCLPGRPAAGDRGRHLPRRRQGQARRDHAAVQGPGDVHRARRRRPPGRAQGRGPRHRRPRQRRRRRSPPTPRACRRRAPRVVVTTDLHITGKVAQFGRGIIGDVSQEADGAVRRQPQHDARRAAGRRDRRPPTATAADAAARPAPRRHRSRPSADPSPPAARSAPTPPQAGAAPPRRRRCARSTARPAEPVDLAGVAGPAILKRLAAAVVGGLLRAAVRRCAAGADAARRLPTDGRPRPRASARCSAASPQGAFEVVVRDADGEPVVIRNAPLLDDGTPMPTRYWLVGPREVLAVSRLEAAGGVRRAEADGRPGGDRRRPRAATPPSATPPSRPTTRARARPAASAAPARASSACTPTTPGSSPAATTRSGGGSPTSSAPAAVDVEVGPSSTRRSRHAGRRPCAIARRPGDRCCADELVDPDPPSPAQLTNAIGDRRRPPRRRAARGARRRRRATTSHVRGDEAWHLAAVEPARPDRGRRVVDRPRRRRGRVPHAGHRAARRPPAQPGPRRRTRVDTVLATCCVRRRR